MTKPKTGSPGPVMLAELFNKPIRELRKRKAVRYCDECGHALDRHKRVGRGRIYVYACDYYGCACQLPRLKAYKAEEA